MKLKELRENIMKEFFKICEKWEKIENENFLAEEKFVKNVKRKKSEITKIVFYKFSLEFLFIF